jgi:PAS domain S-box-containing protein
VGTTFEEAFREAMCEQTAVTFEEFFPPLQTWFAVSAYPSETGLSVYFRNVTERRERQQALRDRERKLEEYRSYTDDILNAIDDLFYVVDREGNYRRWNESLRTVTGYSDDEIEAMDPLAFIAEEDRERVTERIGGIFETGNGRVEARVQTKTGRRIPMEFVASAVEGPDGERVVAGIGRDITDLKDRQRQLEASNERLEQFAYAASHDLQEPLRMVSSYLQLIERRYGDALDDDGREFLEFAVDGADRMREMIDGLLEYSRIESEGASFEPVDLDEVLADVRENLRVLSEECDADISVAPLPRVQGDRGQLRQLFQNLLDNAMTYSGDEPPRIRVSAEREGSQWRLSVSDEGVGIDPGDADRIFEVFQSLHGPDDQGSGIGLALCKRIVERHGGDIWVESSPGEGATFSFTLPNPGDVDE